MRTEIIKGHTVEMFDSIDQLPITRYHAFNKYIMIDSGIGSDINDADKRMANTIQMIVKGDHSDAINELNNLRQTLAFIMGDVNPKMLSFGTLVKKIDGIDYDDMSQPGIDKVIGILSNAQVSFGMISGLWNEIKKKLMRKSRHTSRTSQTPSRQRNFLHI